MMKKFFATTIKCYEEDDVLIIALSDDSVAPSNFMIITRLDDEDNAMVNDGIGFQTDQAEYEMPDAIEKVVLRSDSLEVVVKPEFASFFGGLSILAEISQESCDSSEQIDMLKDALQNIFSGAQVELII
ncbi:hypothetical protein [Pseudomonas syringae group genomosp. 3]|uniref:hypothetical protein n=1 Tax=Pseudomonas syringae group genomosp. 3 TaxID=251701 RepID=UPI0005CAAF7C|nr:hypothetical protein [Pseudomonas syringae group genomosp. 3]KPX70877.1 hypothetical protein ALO84_200132 [Pseudomonas syringae pv. maculicola]RMO77510.1 hypothetical protein ALQ34_200107 [Pseudomonas syringae pv. maculicola]